MTVYKRAVKLMEAELGDELVALDPAAGQCFGFNNVATSVWRQLEQPKDLNQLRDALAAEYDVEPERCERELKDLLDDLCEKRLIVLAE
ncbi:MAG: PqqD family protein [Sphingomicrobium sp.]